MTMYQDEEERYNNIARRDWERRIYEECDKEDRDEDEAEKRYLGGKHKTEVCLRRRGNDENDRKKG